MKKLNPRVILSLALSAVLFVSVLAPASFAETDAAADSAGSAPAETVRLGRNRRADAAEPENAIGQDAAVAKVLSEAGIAADQTGDIVVHVAETSDGSVVYRVHFVAGGQRYSGEVDAVSGEVLCTDTRSDSDFVRGQRGGAQGQSTRGGRRGGSCAAPEADAAS